MTLVRRKDAVAWGALAAAAIAPDPAVARYVLALPGLLLAFAAPRAAARPRRVAALGGRGRGGARGLAQIRVRVARPHGRRTAARGLCPHERRREGARRGRRRAAGLRSWTCAARVGAGETFAFDQSLELPYLAWETDLRYRAIWIPDTLQTSESVDGFLESENVRVVAVDEDSPTGQWLTQNNGRYLKLFHCKSAPCSVFVRR